MNVKAEIALIVVLQIVLIVSSFLVLVFIESEWLLLSNSIDVAGKNRYLTSMVILEIRDVFDLTSDTQTFESVKQLRENIYLLKEGGKTDELKLRTLPPELLDGWNGLNEKFLKLETKSMTLLALQDTTKISNVKMELEDAAFELIVSSDLMVKEIATFTEEKDELLINLQLIFLITNVVVHAILVLIIFRILDNEANDRIRREKLVTIGKIGAGLTHDLRTPISILRMSFDLLKMDIEKDPSSKEKIYQKIENAIDKLEYQTTDVLEFVQTRDLNKEDVGVKEILNKSLGDLTIPKEIEIKVLGDEIIHVDKTQIQIVFSNIIQNAIQELGNKGKIIVSTKKTSDKVIINFEDNGSGIDKNILPLIFEPLYTTKNTGTGLGLANCKRIVEEHGGKISVKNKPTTFSIEIPKN